MTKHLTIIGVNYYPENTSTGLYTTQLAEYLTTKGIKVNVVTGFPYYPAWKIDDAYQNKKNFIKETINGVNVLRYKQYVPNEPSFTKRIVHLIDFTFGSIINIFKTKKTDVVLCIVPFTSTIFLGWILSRFKRAKLWVHIQDFEFDAATETMISGKNKSVLFKLLFFIEKYLLKKADISSTISNSMLEKLESKNNNNKPKLLLPNWVDVNTINPANAKVHKYLSSQKFKILYSGNIGEKQDWNVFIQFAKKLEEYKDIEIVVVGDGGKREWLTQEIKHHKNVTHYFPVAYEELTDLLCATDLHILFQKEEVKDTVMPSKLLAMMASKKPSLVTGNLESEVAKILIDSNGGKYFSNQQMQEMINFVLELKGNKDLAVNYGENARNFIGAKFDYHTILNQFSNVLQKHV